MSKKSLKKEMVMKAQELRINNYLTKIDGTSIQVTSLEIKCAEEMNGHFNSTFEPIPLTEEWLLKLGFVNNCLTIKGILFEVGYVGYDFVNNEMTLRINQFISLKIQHVHQLQNLYFTLTNEELS
jgi:hypothetical protein